VPPDVALCKREERMAKLRTDMLHPYQRRVSDSPDFARTSFADASSTDE
jgi:hypothetical protein